VLPPRRAALPLGTSSLGACGALLPREPRPVEGSRSSRRARRSGLHRCPQGVEWSLYRGSGREGKVGGSVQWGSIETGREAGRKSSCGCTAVRADRREGGGLRGRAAAGADRRRGRYLERALRPPRGGGGGGGPGRPLVEPLAETVHVEGRRTRAAGRGTASRSARPPSPALIDGLAVSDLAQTAVDPNRPGVPRGPLARARASRPEAPGGPDPRVGPQRRPPGWREAYDASPSGRPAPASAASRDSRAVEGARCSRWPRRSGSPRSVSVSWAGTARRRPRPAGTP
jgi:hypothetical protein